MDKYLCYVKGNFAYFTDDMSEQWGDDWDDAPYEHNAGEPYTDKVGDTFNHYYSIEKIAFDCDLSTPGELAGLNSQYSVKDINNGATPWLSSHPMETEATVEINAGVTITEFIDKIISADGEVFFKLTN